MTVWSRFIRLGAPAGVTLLAGGIYHNRDELKAHAATIVGPPPPYSSVATPANAGFGGQFPYSDWDYNWDKRDPLYLVDQDKFSAADEETRKEMLSKVTPAATRHLFLIRHGQYHLDSEKKNLTPLGREQAAFLGKRLENSGMKFDSLVMSTMCRATETANIIMEQMQPIQNKSDSIIEEGAPYPPVPPVPHWNPKAKTFHAESARIEAGFRKYFHRASPKQKADSYELIVCHANVIRYWVCRALQFPPEGWLRMSLGNCSITWVVIRPSGAVSIRAIGDIGHLPAEKISFT
ncbi:Protein PGAM-5 [Aphelenchoides avenae]|nr:Protein PGAM-5 [Aphelenchus avenae]